MEEKKEMSQDQKDELIKKELEEAEILEKKLASERRDEVSRMVADLEKENSDREDQENKETEEPDREKKAEEIGNRLKETAFDGTFYVENLVRSEQGLKRTENYTETCQYYAMFCGLAEDSLIDCMLKNFGADRPSDRFAEVSKSNAFIGNFLRLYYLAENKLYQKLLAESKEYFLYMAKETQTLWENDTKTASCNHGFASIVAKWIAESLGQA